MAEAMLLGKPVIATNYSGNVDFMSPQDSLLVSCKLVPLAHDIQPYKKGYLWAEPSRAEAAHWLRWAFEHPDEAKELGQKARIAAKQVLSMEAAGQRLLARLHSIAGRSTTAASTPASKAA
jgi:glycosyltransferase involved in cell wall biosynthesis